MGHCLFFFSQACFPLKVPIATCIVCLKVINQMYCIAVNLPVSFVPSTKCMKNASMKFCVWIHVKIKKKNCLSYTVHSDCLMFLVQVNTIRTMCVLLFCSFDLVVTRNPLQPVGVVEGGWGICGLFIAVCISSLFLALCDKPFFF